MPKHFLILGTGCDECKKLERTTIEIVKELGIDAIVTSEGDEEIIKSFGVTSVPGLVIDNNLVLSTQLPDKKGLYDLIEKLSHRDV